MSFSFEFSAAPLDVPGLVDKEYAPETVKAFIRDAVAGLHRADYVYVKAMGHLHQQPNDYQVSNATIEVKPVVTKKLPVPESV